MSERIAIVAATKMEIGPLLDFLTVNGDPLSQHSYAFKDFIIDIVITGIGVLRTTYSLMQYLHQYTPTGWIQVGIGGTMDDHLHLGEVYQIKSETLFAEGAQDKNGLIHSPFDLGWLDKNQAPYTEGLLICPFQSSLDSVSGMTTLHAHGEAQTIDNIRRLPHGQIENMEGTSFFYISLLQKIPFLCFRSISNVVEVRDTSKWEIPRAIRQLNTYIIQLLQKGEPETLFRMAANTP